MLAVIKFINEFMIDHGSETFMEKWNDDQVQKTLAFIVDDKKHNDSYTESIIRCQYKYHIDYVQNRLKSSQELGIKFRLPSIPEDISENMIKFMIHKHGDTSSRWSDHNTGDLMSDIEGKQECKCFTSNGPLSFTPKSDWGAIYFLDARKWLDDRYVLYRTALKRTSAEWNNITVSKTQTMGDQCKQGRRPRISWNALQPQLAGFCDKIYEGNFDDIFTLIS